MPKQKKRKPRWTAATADRHVLYEDSVQAPDYEVHFCRRVYNREFGREAKVLREDFCGTAAISCQWVKGKRDCKAIGVDLDPEPLEWGRKHNLSKLKEDERKRVTLIEGNVLSSPSQKADVIAALNFSYFVFKKRSDLLQYFNVARENLKRKGLLVIDLMGGPNAQLEDTDDPREKDGYKYLWEHHKFDPISHHTICRIHFEFRDGSKMKAAFEYDWRLWTIPELRDLLEEAGFRRTDVYWEGTDRATGGGDGVYRKRDRAEADASWVAYIVAVK